MIKQVIIISAMFCILLLSNGSVNAADTKQVYGSQLMTEQERNELRQKMRNAKTDAERQKIRNEHHQKMQQRAKAQGVTLPDKPPAYGGGKGGGKGRGMGAGKGYGGGSGRGKSGG